MIVDLSKRDIRWLDESYCLTAVKQNGYALQYVVKQTKKICLAAVEQNGYALRYVKKQTPVIVEQALLTTPTLDVNLIKITQEEWNNYINSKNK